MEILMPRRKQKNGALDPRQFLVNTDDPKTKRVAAFLIWAAQRHPFEYIPYNVIVQAINGYRRLPRMESDEVTMIKNCMTGVRRHLQGNQRELVSQPGIGVRATVDDADTLKTALPNKVKRLQAAKRAVISTASIIDPNAIPDTKENEPWKKWLKGSVRAAIKELESPTFERKLLPPSEQEENEPS
jgi:hypothetical protein